ncbi:ankyrin and armadillo repeat-containing protein-like [Anneissia japonica]|uniref:ankyrin and armadillo repeat-containing protein-like n=1 Tax=Anneissia japonica TaxID=1529436 RepID=UPI0014259D37|nr:ankyrin and armadillo repeat-containing protein-like [Anneissia japonica]
MYGNRGNNQEKDEYAKERAIMNDVDDNGWSHIHHAAMHGFIKSIERFVAASEDQLEFPTNCSRQLTPLLVSVDSGKLETVQCLVQLGSDLRYSNQHNTGIVELACMKGYVDILEYFIALNHKDLPVWTRLMKFLLSDNDSDAIAATNVLTKLTKSDGLQKNEHSESIISHNGIPTLVKVIKSMINDKAKVGAYQVLLNLLSMQVVKDQFVTAGGIPISLDILKGKDASQELMLVTAVFLCKLSEEKEFVDLLEKSGGIEILIKLCQTSNDAEILVQVIDMLGLFAASDEKHQQSIGGIAGSFSALVALFDSDTSKVLLLSLAKAVSFIVRGNKVNQDAFVNEGGSSVLITMASMRNRELQLNAIHTLHMVAKDNPHTQKAILEEGGVMPLMQLLKRSRAPKVHVVTAGALWALAGEDIEEQRTMAGMVGVQLLIEFLNALADNDLLHYIGAEGLAVLSQGPHNKQNIIAQANGVQPLVRLLRSPKEHIVLSAIRALRYLCVGIGFIPQKKNQNTILSARGIRYLVALMVHSRNELVQVEAALTLGSCSIGNSDVMNDVSENMEFDYVHILRLLYSKEEIVRLLAGSALAAFAFNNVAQQQEIAESGGVRYHCFVPYLKSDDEFYRCNAAFQVVVLARIIPDEDQATSSAIGIKLLVDMLEQSKNDQILTITCDCIARLAHTRAGVPAAIVSIESIDKLCGLLCADNEQVRGSAAIALGYLSFNHIAERQLLNKCRLDPYFFKVIRYFTHDYKLSPAFIEAWQHYKHIGLPPINTSERPSLVSKKSATYITNGKNTDGTSVHGTEPWGDWAESPARFSHEHVDFQLP